MTRQTIIHKARGWFAGITLLITQVTGVLSAAGADAELSLDEATRMRCVAILREGLKSDEFWPAMHAAEALTVAGYGAEVRPVLLAKLPIEQDDQRRCGLARELVRAGDLKWTQLMLDILASPNPHGHVHACESLYKVWQIGDGTLLRKAMTEVDQPKKALMAAAALTRWGDRGALEVIRKFATHEDGETAKISAWILARTGDASDIPVLRQGVRRFEEPLTKAYFQYALACLGDADGMATLVGNLSHSDFAVRVYACEFAPDARALGAKDGLLKLLNDEVLDARIRAAQALLMLAQPAASRNEGIVRDVFPASAEHPRYSEGSILALGDGRLMSAITEFIGNGSDFAKARIIAVESKDGGRTWGERRVLQENVGQTNVMSATLRRLSSPERFDAPIGFFYLVKNSPSDLQVWLRMSLDDGRTFGEPVRVSTTPGYHVLNNDRITVLSSGRIVVPVASTKDVHSVNRFECSCFLSDDGGKSWRAGRNAVAYDKRGAMEPEVIELSAGHLLMHFRTQLGHIAVSDSKDGGETWSPARSWNVRAPEAPATLRRIPSTGDLLLIWNDNFTAGAGHGGKRTPLTAAVSTDNGATWTFKRPLETSPDQTFAYTSVLFHEGRAVLSYYVRDEKTGRISSRFRSLPIGWFYESDAR